MTKQEEIEEMEDIMNCSWNTKSAAAALYNAGYRKIDDDYFDVITKVELKQYKAQAVKEFAEMLKNNGCKSIILELNYITENRIDELLKEYEK